jgi:hypothetical protein
MKLALISVLIRNWKNWRFWAGNLVLLALALAGGYVEKYVPLGPFQFFPLMALMMIYLVVFSYVWLEPQWWQLAVILGIIVLYIVFNYDGERWKRFAPDPQGPITIKDTTK